MKISIDTNFITVIFWSYFGWRTDLTSFWYAKTSHRIIICGFVWDKTTEVYSLENGIQRYPHFSEGTKRSRILHLTKKEN